MDTVTRMYPRADRHICSNCGSENVSYKPTPFADDECARLVKVYHCRDCRMIDVPDFDDAA